MDKIQQVIDEIKKLIYIYKEEWRNEDPQRISKISLGARIAMLEEMLVIVRNIAEKPCNKPLTFKAIPRLLDMIEPSNRSKSYCEKLAKSLEHEGYPTDAKIVRENIKIMEGGKVPMATMDEESVSNDLEEAAECCMPQCMWGVDVNGDGVTENGYDFNQMIQMFKSGVHWQQEQFEKNRLNACNTQTEDDAQIEMDFAVSIIENEHRTPTFDDAIKYGMRLQAMKDNQDESDMALIAALDGAERGKKAMKAQMLKELPKWRYKEDNSPLLHDSIILNKYGCVAKSPSGAIVSDVWVIGYDELAKLPKEEQL